MSEEIKSEEIKPEEISQKSKANAAVAYGFLFVSWLLLFNKKKEVNNPFVRSHIKSSIIIHFLILLNYVIFISLGFLRGISIFGLYLNIILADIFFILIGILLVRGVYNAINAKEQKIGNSIKLTTGISLDINNDHTFDEKDKFTIILSHIPFLGYIIGSKFKNEKIENILKLNLIAMVFICLVYILGYSNIANLLLLFYIIFISFSGVYLYGKDELISINLPNYLLPNALIKIFKNFLKYLFNYFKGSFKEFKVIEAEENEKEAKMEVEEKALLDELPPIKLPKFLIYIPILNFILLFQKENNYKYHVRNGITLNFVLILFLVLVFFRMISSNWLIFFLFPICFGIGELEIKYYKMPFVYELYEIFVKLKNLFYVSKKKIDEKRKEVKEERLEVKK